MEHSPEQVYTDLLRQLASPAGTDLEVLAKTFHDVERMHSMGQITDWQLQNAREAYARTPGSKIGEAASWAMDKAKDAVESAAEYVRYRATTAVATYTKEEPVRAILIAAGTGALLMLFLVIRCSPEYGASNARFRDKRRRQLTLRRAVLGSKAGPCS